MTRIAWVLTALTGVLVGAMWFLFLYSPTSDEIEETRSQTDQAIAQTSTLRAEAARLRQVRESAPEAEAQIAAAQALLPDESSMPSLLRQLQTAADEAGATLLSVQPSQPVEAQDENVSLVGIAVQMNVRGTYFQIVDLARRLEDPSITARGMKWRNAQIDIEDEDAWPTLSATLSIEVYARSGFALPAGIADATEDPAPADGTEEADEDDGGTELEPTSDGVESTIPPAPAGGEEGDL